MSSLGRKEERYAVINTGKNIQNKEGGGRQGLFAVKYGDVILNDRIREQEDAPEMRCTLPSPMYGGNGNDITEYSIKLHAHATGIIIGGNIIEKLLLNNSLFILSIYSFNLFFSLHYFN